MNWRCLIRHKWDEWEYLRPTEKGEATIVGDVLKRLTYARHTCLRCGKTLYKFRAAD